MYMSNWSLGDFKSSTFYHSKTYSIFTAAPATWRWCNDDADAMMTGWWWWWQQWQHWGRGDWPHAHCTCSPTAVAMLTMLTTPSTLLMLPPHQIYVFTSPSNCSVGDPKKYYYFLQQQLCVVDDINVDVTLQCMYPLTQFLGNHSISLGCRPTTGIQLCCFSH